MSGEQRLFRYTEFLTGTGNIAVILNEARSQEWTLLCGFYLLPHPLIYLWEASESRRVRRKKEEKRKSFSLSLRFSSLHTLSPPPNTPINKLPINKRHVENR